jgi:hypothetical protein
MNPFVLEAIEVARHSGLKFTMEKFAEYILAVQKEASSATAGLHVIRPSCS